MPAMTHAELTALLPPDFCLDHCRERSENPSRHPGVGRRHLAHGRETLVMEPSGFLTGVEATPDATEHHFGGERSDMHPTQRREQFRAILAGDRCVHPASVFDPISARIAEDLGFEVAFMAASIASATVLGAPD